MWQALGVLLILRAFTVCGGSSNDLTDALKVLMKEEEGVSCNGCSIDNSLSDDDANELRLAFIKAQILQKLDLQEAPRVSNLGKVPFPLQMSTVASTTENPHQNDPNPDQLILLATSSEIALTSKWPTASFKFQIPKDLGSIGSAALWVFKKGDFFRNGKQVLSFFDVSSGDQKKIERHRTAVSEGWVQIDVSEVLKNWLDQENFIPILSVECQNCGYDSTWSPIALNYEQKPLLVINTLPNNKYLLGNRGRRNLRCVPGMTECCRERLVVNFSEIGWDEWILTPKTYEAYFCTGSCSSAASATLAGSLYSSMKTRLFHKSKRFDLVPCCTATEYSSLNMIYMKDNETMVFKNLQNMIVEACGCL